MIKKIRVSTWLIIAIVGLLIGGIGSAYVFQQIRQAQAVFPQPASDIPLAADKRYGVTADLARYDIAAVHEALDGMQAAHLAWIRVPFHWDTIQPERNRFNWQPYDLVIETATLRGFQIIAVLDTSPVWARPDETTPHTPPTEVSHFGVFARQVAQRYGDQIKHFQIWHEPNLSQNWGNRHVDAGQYTLMLKNATINIKHMAPDANIISAALAPTTENGPLNLNEFEYLNAMYGAGAAPWFDILAGQLYGFHLPIEPVERNPEILSIHRTQLLRDVMLANGDAQTPIWATAFGWHALPNNWQGQPPTWPSDTPELQAQRTRDAIEYVRANWPWLGPMLAVRWDDFGLAADDSARGFAISPNLITPYQDTIEKPNIATLGSYSASHFSARYSNGWHQASGVADIPVPSDDTANPTLTIPFEGTRLDLKLNRGTFRGYLRITIDDQPSDALPQDEFGRSYVVLYDPLNASDTVTIAQYLSDEAHVAVIEPDGGWGQWAIAGWTVYREADTRMLNQWLMIALAVVGVSGVGLIWGLGQYWHTIWSSILQVWQRLQVWRNSFDNRLQIAVTFALALGFFLAPPPINVVFLPVLGLAFILRLDAGLMVLSASISFFLVRQHVLVTSVSILELTTWLLIGATFLRIIIDVAQEKVSLTSPNAWLRSTDFAVAALFVLSVIATMTAANFGVSMFELRTLIIGSIAFYILLRLIPWLENADRPIIAHRLIDAFVLGATLHAAMALFQYFISPEQTINAEGVRRALGYVYGSPNNLSLFLDRAFPIMLALVSFGTNVIRRGLYGVGLIIVSIALFLTFRKGQK